MVLLRQAEDIYLDKLRGTSEKALRHKHEVWLKVRWHYSMAWLSELKVNI
jgi:hypothetical protein